MRATVLALTSVSEEERALLLLEVGRIDKEFEKSEFKLSRTKRDKDITINVLNNSIANLEETTLHLEQANVKLSKQQDLLRKQKEIIEEKSQTLLENLAKLERSYEELEQFAYIASHDLKSPLRTISNFAQLLKRRYSEKLDDTAREFLDYIVAGAVQMHDVICDSLEYSKVGKLDFDFEQTDLNQLFVMLRLHLQREMELSNATLTVDPLPTIRVNKTSLLQLFQNLVSNAIKFKGYESPKVHISWKKLGEGFEFRVQDNGMGIDPIYHEKVFRPFQRLNNEKKNGTGIGLAICRKIVAMHGGEIHIESAAGQGATFVFTLFPTSIEPSVEAD